MLYGSSSICLKKKINFKAFLSTSFIDPNEVLVVQQENRAPEVLQVGAYRVETLFYPIPII